MGVLQEGEWYYFRLAPGCGITLNSIEDFIDWSTLGMWTTQTDKNKREVYQGDQVLGGDAKTVSEVYWRNGGFGIKNEFTAADPDSITFINLETCEVIGTIFDNPDPSKKEK